MKKRILINLRQLQQPYTGVQSYIYNLVRSLVIRCPNYHYSITTVNYDGKNKYINDLLTYNNVSLINVRGLNNSVFGMLFDIFLINRYIKDYDLYFCPVNILPFHRIKNIPHVVGVLDLCTFIVPETTTLTLKTYYDLYLGTSLKRADAIVTISHNTKKDLMRLFAVDESKIKVVHLGIDQDLKENPLPEEESRILEGLGLSKNTKYFLTIVVNGSDAVVVIRAPYHQAAY